MQLIFYTLLIIQFNVKLTIMNLMLYTMKGLMHTLANVP